ncbi:MAG: DUF3025 domain-containing protein [Betaproteobacteria bacterium]
MDTPLHPGHAALLPMLARGVDGLTLVELNDRAAAMQNPPLSESGARIVFVEPGLPLAAVDYERGILQTGRVPTRPGNRHDLFNALCWIAFPRFKRACNALHSVHATTERSTARGPARDALTLLDESGVIVLCAEPELASLLRNGQWKALFRERRVHVMRSLRFFVCGHALHEKLLTPYPALTGKALIVDAPPSLLGEALAAQRDFADTKAAERISAGITSAQLPPLPLSGIPGWHAANEADSFYDDNSIFRPARNATTAGNASTVSHSASAPASDNSSAEP